MEAIMKRYGQVIQVKPEMLEKYKALHADPWPEIIAKIKDCNLDNYSIFYRDGFLFAYFEYTGSDFDVDMAKMAADPMTQKWWGECKPCQKPVESAGGGEWWADMQEVFHLE
jgi:L-rhamnose mutarotase